MIISRYLCKYFTNIDRCIDELYLIFSCTSEMPPTYIRCAANVTIGNLRLVCHTF